MLSFRQKATCESSECYVVCGATLISKDYANTAAHCINTTNPSDITLIAGMHQQSSTTETNTRQVRTVEEIHIHSRYYSIFVPNSRGNFIENDRIDFKSKYICFYDLC